MISGCDASTNQINGPGSCFYDADLRDVQEPLSDAYLEVWERRSDRGGRSAWGRGLEGLPLEED